MNKSMRDINDIESVLKKLPKVKDERSAQMIYMGIQESKDLQGRKQHRFRYVVVSAVAIIIFSIITSTFLLNEQHSSEEQYSMGDRAKLELQENSSDDATSNTSQIEEGGTNAAVQAANEVKLLYPSDIGNDDYFTLAVPSLDAQYFVPLTVKLVTKAMEPNMNMLKEVEGMLNEAAYGLADYFPLNAQFSYLEEAKAVIVDVPSENDYRYTDRVFLETLQETFAYHDIEKIFFKTDGQSGIEFSHMGMLEEDEVMHHRQRAIYLYQINEQSPQLFVSSINTYDHISKAFEAMQQGDDPANEAISTTIPASVKFEKIEDNGQRLIVTFSSDAVLENNKQYEMAIAAMLLTAREFDFQSVLFQNGNIDAIGSFNLNGELEVPIAPNLIEIN